MINEHDKLFGAFASTCHSCKVLRSIQLPTIVASSTITIAITISNAYKQYPVYVAKVYDAGSNESLI